MQRRLLWRIYVYFLLAALIALALVTGNAVRISRHFHETYIAEGLELRGRMAAREILHYLPTLDTGQVDRLCRELGALSSARMTVILPDGGVIGDSEESPEIMDNHADRPEIAQALRGNLGSSVRYSDTLKKKLKYMALPVQRDGVIIAVVRMSQPLAEIRWTQQAISGQLLVGGLLAAVLFALVALYLSRRTTRPLEEIRLMAERLAKGDFSSRVVVTTNDEIGVLARTIQDMAVQLDERMDTITRQHVEQEAVLACMVEGVLAVDTEGRVLYLNEALGRLLDIELTKARGRSVQELVRHHEIQRFVQATLTNAGPSEAELLVQGIAERHLQLHGTPLEGPGQKRMGGLIVVNDITRLKRLERVRSDFVANVSHELKTPITALKGCVETLSGENPPAPEDASRFIAMMSRHVSRMESIVEDLLSLSRIEFESAQKLVRRDRVSMGEMLQRAAHAFSKAAESRKITVQVSCPENIVVHANGALLEQAVGNLVDNAIKYSGEGTVIDIACRRAGDQVVIDVIDQGPGIENKHIARIFERFYRVDTARSRALGGTGLGLAIVKHIALAHQGSVTVQSAPGLGTTFSLHLPLSPE